MHLVAFFLFWWVLQIELDFACLFGEKTAAKFLERWPTTFMQKVIQQSKGLNPSQELQDLIDCAESAMDTESDEDGKLFFNKLITYLCTLLIGTP